MSETEFFSTEPANFFLATEKKPRLNLCALIDFDESKTTAPVITANALRGHKDIFVSGEADVANRLFMNRVEMRDEHNGSLPANEDKIAFTDERFAFEFFAKPLEELLLSGTQEIFQDSHADTSSAWQLGQRSPTMESLWKNFSHSEH